MTPLLNSLLQFFLYISKVLNIYDHMFKREIWKNIVVEFALLLFILFVTYNNFWLRGPILLVIFYV